MQPPFRKVITVSQLTRQIKAMMESNFYYLWVEGEVSNLKTSVLGHSYFTLKDKGAQIRAVIFKGQMRKMRFKPESGSHLVCRGMVSVYAERGEYQLIIDRVEPIGVGARQLALEQLKETLRKEGIFDISRKRPLPSLPRRVGVITSPKGAAIRDILKVLERRFSNISLLLYPVRVQGAEAAIEISEGIEELNRLEGVDVIIAGRGGGSTADLWAFNEEAVVRAIYNSRVPVISAVGHETDYTLSDMTADLSAPTPSVAAELVVKSKAEFVTHLSDLEERLRSLLLGILREKAIWLHKVEKGLIDPRARVRDLKRRLSWIFDRLSLAVSHTISSARLEVKGVAQRLDGLSPLNVLGRGYSITRKMPAFTVVMDSGEVAVGDDLNILLARGELFCKVYEKAKV